jgi:putative methyltransferase (TIGR04325 family)
LSHISNLTWSIVEQPHFVETGRKYIAVDVLEFTETIEQALNANSTNILILGSVLQYLPSPRSFLDELLKHNWDYVIVDRTPFLIGEAIDRLTIQSVPPSIYSAKYPAWFFNEKAFLNSFIYNYQMFAEWNSPDKYPLEGANTIFKGFFFQNVSNGKS